MLATNNIEAIKQVVIGDTVYINDVELIVTQTRLDQSAAGTTALIWLTDPILHQKEKMEREKKDALIDSQKIACDTVTKVMRDENG